MTDEQKDRDVRYVAVLRLTRSEHKALCKVFDRAKQCGIEYPKYMQQLEQKVRKAGDQ